MKLTKDKLKQIIREEIAPLNGSVKPAKIEKRFQIDIARAIEAVGSAVAATIEGKLISGHEDKGPVVSHTLRETDEQDGIELHLSFEDGTEELLGTAWAGDDGDWVEQEWARRDAVESRRSKRRR